MYSSELVSDFLLTRPCKVKHLRDYAWKGLYQEKKKVFQYLSITRAHKSDKNKY